MKILKYALGIIAILLIGFLLMGVFKPEISYTNEITVDKSIKEAWGVMQDESKTKDWVTGMKSMELVSGDNNEVGSVRKIIMENNGKEMEIMETLMTLKEFEQIGMKFDNEFMENMYNMYVAEKDGKTVIRAESVSKGKGMIARSMFALSGSTMKEEDMKMLEKLKTLIEENTTDYYPTPMVDAEESSEEVGEGEVMTEEKN